MHGFGMISDFSKHLLVLCRKESKPSGYMSLITHSVDTNKITRGQVEIMLVSWNVCRPSFVFREIYEVLT